MARNKLFRPGSLFMIAIIAIIGIYLFGQFFPEGAEGRELVIPSQEELESTTMWVIKLLIVGGAVFLGTSVTTRLSGGSVGRKQIMTLIVLGAAVYFLWIYILEPVFNAQTLDQISFAVGQKMGLI